MIHKYGSGVVSGAGGSGGSMTPAQVRTATGAATDSNVFDDNSKGAVSAIEQGGSLTSSEISAVMLWAIQNSGVVIGLNTFYYIPVSGQSLSLGQLGTSLTHDTSTFGSDVLLYSGVPPKGVGFNAITESDVLSTIDYVESTVETHGWSMFNYMYAEGALIGKWLYASTGLGGKTIDELTSTVTGTPWGWNNTTFAYDSSLNITPSGYELKIPFSLWIHGEANYLNYEGYKEDLRTYHNNLQSYTGKTFPLLIDQTGRSGSLNVANELLEYAVENNDAHMVLPKYWLNRLYNGDIEHIHLDADGYMLQGEYFGRAATAIMTNAEVPVVYPESWSVLDAFTLRLDFHVPEGANLIVDTDFLPLAPGLGLGVTPVEGEDEEAATSYIQNGSSIDFTMTQAITTDAVFEIGNTLSDAGSNDGQLLPCINLRDDSSDMSPSQGINLYNWCAQRVFQPTEAQGALNRHTGNLWVYGDYSGIEATAFSIAVGKGSDWLLTGMSSVQVDFDYTVTSGASRMLIGDDIRSIPSDGHYSYVAAVSSNLRFALQSTADNFAGTLTNVVITKIS